MNMHPNSKLPIFALIVLLISFVKSDMIIQCGSHFKFSFS